MVIRHAEFEIDRKSQHLKIGDRVYDYSPRRGRKSPYSRSANLFFTTLEFLLLAGQATRHQLYDRLYGDSVDGGPQAGVDVMYVHLHHWKPRFEKMGLFLRQEKRGGTLYYRLEIRHGRSHAR